MFEWLNYKKRLTNVGKELAEIVDQLGSIAELDTLPKSSAEPIKKTAAAVVAIAKLLVRVIDSLPG